MRFLWLPIAIAIGVLGFIVAGALNLSAPATITLTTVPAFLASFPFAKRWMPQATFQYWATAAALSTVTGWLLYFALKRLGG
jgi:hypothetical protein